MKQRPVEVEFIKRDTFQTSKLLNRCTTVYIKTNRQYTEKTYQCDLDRLNAFNELKSIMQKLKRGTGAIALLVENWGLEFDDACDIQLLVSEHYKSFNPDPIYLEFWDMFDNFFTAFTINNKRIKNEQDGEQKKIRAWIMF